MDRASNASARSLDRFAILLWEPQDALNLGAVARACRNHDLHDIRALRAGDRDPARMAITAPRCEDFIAQHVRFTDEWQPTVEGLHRVYALTARGREERQQRWRLDDLLAELHHQPDLRVGFLFGREDSGLPNSAVDACHGYVTLETGPWSSLNLAQAVLLVASRIFAHCGEAIAMPPTARTFPPAPADDMDRMMAQAERALERIGFFRGDQRENVLRTLRRVLQHSGPDTQELATLWGVFSRIETHAARLARSSGESESSGEAQPSGEGEGA